MVGDEIKDLSRGQILEKGAKNFGGFFRQRKDTEGFWAREWESHMCAFRRLLTAQEEATQAEQTGRKVIIAHSSVNIC